MGEGYIFAPVCHSVHRGGTWAGTPPQAGTPPLDRQTPWQVHPLGRYTPWQVHPPGQIHSLAGTRPSRYTPMAGTPPWQVHPPAMHDCDTVNKRVVHILLECFLVRRYFFSRLTTGQPVDFLGENTRVFNT